MNDKLKQAVAGVMHDAASEEMVLHVAGYIGDHQEELLAAAMPLLGAGVGAGVAGKGKRFKGAAIGAGAGGTAAVLALLARYFKDEGVPVAAVGQVPEGQTPGEGSLPTNGQ